MTSGTGVSAWIPASAGMTTEEDRQTYHSPERTSVPLEMSEAATSFGNYIQEDPNGQRAEVGCEGRGDLGVRFDLSTSSRRRRLNELRVEEVPELAVP